MWTYSQSSGALTDPNGKVCATGYSGHGRGVNNPSLQDEPDIGPIPQGLYSIGAPRDDPRTGPFSLPLVAHDGNQMFGRDGFFMHGDSIEHPGVEEASHGCIVIAREFREAVWSERFGPLAAVDHILKVVA